MMRSLFILLLVCFTTMALQAQENQETSQEEGTQVEEMEVMVVEAACGMCKLDMPGNSCKIAVVIDDNKYYVEGFDIHDYGDAHGENGMCNTVRKAKVRDLLEIRSQGSEFRGQNSGQAKRKK